VTLVRRDEEPVRAIRPFVPIQGERLDDERIELTEYLQLARRLTPFLRPLDELIPRLGQIDGPDELVEGSERKRKRAQLAFERVEASDFGVGRTNMHGPPGTETRSPRLGGVRSEAPRSLEPGASSPRPQLGRARRPAPTQALPPAGASPPRRRRTRQRSIDRASHSRSCDPSVALHREVERLPLAPRARIEPGVATGEPESMHGHRRRHA
jgi:hypothetical protein